MGKYTTLLFDADDTLLDFNAAEYKGIKQTFITHGVPHSDEDIKLYSAINLKYWKMFERGEITKERVYTGRFEEFFSLVGSNASPQAVADDYLHNLSAVHDLLDGALDMLKALYGKYDMYITTNGYAENQYRRTREAGLMEYVTKLFVSEEIGYQKPDRMYFETVLHEIPEKDRMKVLVIGDSPTSDILGGLNAGLDTCHYNPHGIDSDIKATYTVSSFDELLKLLG